MPATRMLSLVLTLLVFGISLNCSSSSNSNPTAAVDTEAPEDDPPVEDPPEDDPPVDDPPVEELQILFIGNSLTYTNNLPGLVETIAEASGHSISTTTIARPNFSLEDHWRDGVLRAIQRLEPDLVLMQQGPSSLAANQIHLSNWAGVLDETVRAVGGQSGLLMVWPSFPRVWAFPAVYESYRNAALAIDGRFIPAGQAFFAAIAVGELEPYGPDRFHPSKMGSIIAALTVVRTLHPDALDGLPGRMVPTDSSNPTIDLGTSTETVFELVNSAVEKYGI